MPDTGLYLLLGLGVVFTIMAGYIGSMVIRWRNIQKDMELINELRDEN